MQLLAPKLHTAARRYCMEQIAHWNDRYSQLHKKDRNGPQYSRKEKRIFPRYNVLQAILIEIERDDPAACVELEETRQRLIKIGKTAEGMFTQSPDEIQQRTMREEREAFQRYIEQIDEYELYAIQPLFYRRTLAPAEHDAIWARLRHRWEITEKFWYPLYERPQNDLFAWYDSAFLVAVPIQQILRERGICRVWELREYGAEYEIDVAAFEPCYTGAEGYWCADAMDWVIYASHEASITVGGGWLLDAIRQRWPKWRENRWPPPIMW